MLTKTKKISIITTALAGSILATSVGGIVLSACASNNNTNTSPSIPNDQNHEFEGKPFNQAIDWNNQETVSKLIKDDQGLVFASETKEEIIALDPTSKQTMIAIPSTVKAITGYKKIINTKSKATASVNTGAFENSNITNVIFSGNPYIIGAQAFKNAALLETIQIPKSLSIIDNNAFEGCIKLISIDLSNIKSIGHYAFKDAFLPIVKNLNLYNEMNSNLTLAKAIGIGNSAFENANIESIDFSNNTQLRYIGKSAFKGSKLTKSIDLTMLKNLTEIENETFANTLTLEEIKLSSSISSLGSSVFSKTAATTIDLSETSITNIPSKTFLDAASLQTLKLPSSITTLGDNSFQGTSQIRDLVMPAMLDTLGMNVFNAEYNMDTNGELVISKNASNINNLDFSNTKLTSIPNFAFLGMDKLTNVKMPNSINKMGSYVFANSKISTLDLSQTKLTEIPNYAFNSAIELSNLKLPNAITTFKSHSLQNTPKLKTLTLPSMLETIEENTFNAEYTQSGNASIETTKSSGLTSLDLSKTKVTKFPMGVFMGSALETISLNNQTTSIPDYAFAGSAINKLLLPNGITSIGLASFASADNLQEMSTNNTDLDGTSGKLVLPSELMHLGSDAFSTTKFKTIDFSNVNKITTIPKNIFKNIETLKTVTLSNETKSIGESAFVGNIGLTNINFDSLTKLVNIENNNFNETKLIELDLSKTKINSIKENTFIKLPATLEKVSLPVTITTINDNSFQNNVNGVDKDIKIEYKNVAGDLVMPDSIKTSMDIDTINLNSLGLKKVTNVDLSNMSKLITIAGGTFTDSDILSELILPASANIFRMEEINKVASAAFNSNDTLELLNYNNFELNSANNAFTNEKLANLLATNYDAKIKSDKILTVISTLMNSVGRKADLTNADIFTDNSPVVWPTTSSGTTWFENDVTTTILKANNKWVEDSSQDVFEDGQIPTTMTPNSQIGSALNTSSKVDKDIFFKHNNVVWKWNQKLLGSNYYVITLETVKNHSPIFYKTTNISATKTTTNNIVLFGNKKTPSASVNAKDTGTLNPTEVKIKLDISIHLG